VLGDGGIAIRGAVIEYDGEFVGGTAVIDAVEGDLVEPS